MHHESSAAHRGNRRRWVIGLVLALVILLASPFLLLWYGSWSAGRRVEEQLRAIRAKQQPVTPVELNEFYAAPAPDSDVTQLILDALQPLTTPPFDLAAQPLPVVGRSEALIPPPGQPWDEQEAVEQLLDQFALSLKQFHQASRKNGGARFSVDFQQGLEMLLPHAQNLRSGVRLLTLEAHVRAHRGDPHGAAESILTMFSLADSLENEPVLISQLVRFGNRSLGYGLTHELLPHVDFSDEDLHSLQLAVRAVDCREAIHRALIGERVIGIHIFRNPSGEGVSSIQGALTGLIVGGSQDLSLYLSLVTRMIDAIERSWAEARDAEIEVDTKVKEVAASKLGSMRHIMTMLFLPALSQVSRSGARGEAKQNGTDIAIAIERFRRKHGRLPENLDALVPDFLEKVPLDPFDDRPMRFKSADGVILIYSVGADGIDNGGVEDAGKAEPDIVIQVGKPSPANLEPPE